MSLVLKKMLAAIVAGTMVVSLGGLAACAQNEPEEVAPVEEEQEMRVIGTPSEDALELIVENNTGRDIVGFAVKESSEPEFETSLITAKEKIEDGETVLVYLAAAQDNEDQGSDAAGDSANEADNAAAASTQGTDAPASANEDVNETALDVELKTLYDLALTFGEEPGNEAESDASAEQDESNTAAQESDDLAAEASSEAVAEETTEPQEVILHNLNLAELSEVKLCLKDGIGYLEYKNDAGKTESTLESEKALIEAEEIAAAAAAQAEADAAAAAAQAEADAAAAAASQQYTYDYGSGDTSGGYSGSQAEDSCVDPGDLILN